MESAPIPPTPAGTFRDSLRRVPTGAWLALILGTSLLLKIAVVLVEGERYSLGSDDQGYLETARVWLERGEFRYLDAPRPTVFIMPGFPALLAAATKLLGSGLLMQQCFRVFQAVLVTAALWIVFRIGARHFSPRAALVGVALAAFYLPLWLASNLFLTEAAFTLALAVLVAVALRSAETPSAKWALLFGLAWAAATYIRPSIALWPGVLFLLLAARRMPLKTLLANGAIAGAVLAVCLSPWWVRNYRLSGGEFIPLTKSSGNPLLLGTFPEGVPSLEVQRTWHANNDHWANDAFDTAWAKRRIAEGFRNEPARYLHWYTVGKFRRYWNDQFYWLDVAGVPRWFVRHYHLLIVLAGAVGIWLARRNRGAGVIVSLLAYMTLLHVAYMTQGGRYAVPLIPFVALFAAEALLRLPEAIASLRSRSPGS